MVSGILAWVGAILIAVLCELLDRRQRIKYPWSDIRVFSLLILWVIITVFVLGTRIIP